MLTPNKRISIPDILSHQWLKGASSTDELEGTEDDDDHDFRTGLSF